MAETGITFEELKANKKLINILLLGETGVGKSTFVNAFVNYLRFHDLHQAEKEKLFALIPTQFSITNDKFESHTIYIDSDNNENQEIGVSGMQGTRSYISPLNRTDKTHVQLIDTPGIGDTRGIDQDQMNLENILSHIGQLDDLHAICILLKPNNSRLTVFFEFCIKQLLSRLERSASQNIIFLFSNTRSTFYRPGDTLPALKKILDCIKKLSQGVDIPLSRENMFCIDNEAFRFLAALNNEIKFSNAEKDNFSISWETSSQECERLMSYIISLKPHKVQNTISINEARRFIIQLSQPLAEIAQLIHDNLYALERHKEYLDLGNTTLADLKSKLFIPVINLKVIELTQPTTVCTNSKCCRVYQVGDINKYHYNQRCHESCHLRNVPNELIGSPQLIKRRAINSVTKACKKCKCDFSAHMHVYYMTETFFDKLENDDLKSTIIDKETALEEAKKIVTQIEERKHEFDREREVIIKSSAKFAHFLKNNAITLYNDSYQAYLTMLIDREKSMGMLVNGGMLQHYNKLLNEYLQEKDILDRAIDDSQEASNINQTITAEDILKCIQSLYYLKHNGKKIEELFLKQKVALENEFKNSNDVIKHVNIPLRTEKSSGSNKQTKKKNQNQYNNDNESQRSSIPPELLEQFSALVQDVAKLKETSEQKNDQQQYEQRNQKPIYLRSRRGQRENFRGNNRGRHNSTQDFNQRQSYPNQYGNQYSSQTISPNCSQAGSNQQRPDRSGFDQQDPRARAPAYEPPLQRFNQTDQNQGNSQPRPSYQQNANPSQEPRPNRQSNYQERNQRKDFTNKSQDDCLLQ